MLVSPDFLSSAYCYDIELRRAMERHASGEARVIPVILRHCDWRESVFGKLNATPRDGKPVKSIPDLDEAFLQVAQALKGVLKAIPGPSQEAYMRGAKSRYSPQKHARAPWL
ncbi:MAG TPA: hypothetical protein VEY88_10300 [Archangium sp.]|nr:hypothetical protein [Archangium sp.]